MLFSLPGNDARTQHHGVASNDVSVLVIVDGGPRERAHRFALRPADENQHVLGGIIVDLPGVDHQAWRNVEVAEILRDLGRLDDRASNDGNLAAMGLRQVEGDANAIDRRGETAEEELLLCPREDLVEPGLYRPFARRVSGTIDVGRVLQERQDPALAVFGEGVQIKSLAVGRREIDLEITGMHDYADRSFDRQGDTIHQAVSDPDRLDGEWTDGKL